MKTRFLIILSIALVQLCSAQFSNISSPFTNLGYSSLSVGDYDNDSDLDILIIGSPNNNAFGSVSKIYRNNGDGSFVDSGIELEGVAFGDCAWADYDNDGYLDIILLGSGASGAKVKIYHNNTNGTFQSINTDNFQTEGTSIDAGDYDNDGDLDILITGLFYVTIYKNKGGGEFMKTPIEIPAGYQGSAKWGDYDNDGDLDILAGGVMQSWIYKNNNDGSYSDSGIKNLSGASPPKVEWGDYDNDGYIDILICGNDIMGQRASKIFHNNKNGTFSQIQAILEGVLYGNSQWGDYDSDGYLDLIISGSTTYDNVNNHWIPITKVFHNNKMGTFEEYKTIFENVSFGDVKWADFDKDNDLDLVISGLTASGNTTKLYRNDFNIQNHYPSAPKNLGITSGNNEILFSWEGASDSETPQNALSYNISIGNTSKGSEILNGNSNLATGERRIAQIGNAGNVVSYKIRNLPTGKYYWRVQTIDNGFKGSAFSEGGSFEAVDTKSPMLEALSPIYGAIDVALNDSLKLFFTEPVKTGSGNLYIYEQGNTVPIQTISVSSNNVLGGGTTKIVVNPSDYDKGKKYYLKIDEGAFLDHDNNHFPGILDANTWTFSTPIFNKVNTFPFLGAYNCDAEWGDYDNDGDLDFIISGTPGIGGPVTKIYKNKGNDAFEDSGIDLIGLSSSSVEWGDYDNDGDLDILLSGDNYMSGYHTKIYTNMGNGTFQDKVLHNIASSASGSLKWGDYDNDGDLDILMMGFNLKDNNYITKIYNNNGQGDFVDSQIVLPQICYGEAVWGDYDNDADLDFVIIGDRNAARIYRNDGNNKFTDSGINIEGGWFGSAAWGDYNNDGYWDLIVMGAPDNGSVTKLYKNNGNGSFQEEKNALLLPTHAGSVEWGDYNNDGKSDLLISGYHKSLPVSQIYENIGNGVFTPAGISKTKVALGKLRWGDYDNDGDLDILLTGQSKLGNTIIYKNEISIVNTKPSTPEKLISKVEGKDLILSWEKSIDNQTHQKSLTYNVTTRKNSDTITTSHSLQNGFHKIVNLGNCNINTYILKNIPLGDYQWKVQSLDGGFMSSSFSNEENISIQVYPPSNLLATSFSDSTSKLTWTDNSINESKFVIERSLTNDFSSVTPFITAPNVTSFTDEGLSKNTTYYYRVKALINSFSSFYSNSASVLTLITGSEESLNSSVSIYPNPTDNLLKVVIKNVRVDIVKIELLNIMSKKIKTIQFQKKDKELEKTIDLGGLSSGVYIMDITYSDKKKESQRIIKK